MASLYEEQIRADDTHYTQLTEYTADSNAEAATFFPSYPITGTASRVTWKRCSARQQRLLSR